MTHSLKTFALAAVIAASGLMLTQCAPGLRKSPSRVFVGPSEPLLLRVLPFDSTVSAELRRGGIDPVAFEREFEGELRYRFYLRKQEEAQDSVSAKVVLDMAVRHLQPGTGTSGTFAVFELSVIRGGVTERTEWTLRRPSKENAPAAQLARDLSRNSVDEVMHRIPAARPMPKEPPPPLILLQ